MGPTVVSGARLESLGLACEDCWRDRYIRQVNLNPKARCSAAPSRTSSACRTGRSRAALMNWAAGSPAGSKASGASCTLTAGFPVPALPRGTQGIRGPPCGEKRQSPFLAAAGQQHSLAAQSRNDRLSQPVILRPLWHSIPFSQ